MKRIDFRLEDETYYILSALCMYLNISVHQFAYQVLMKDIAWWLENNPDLQAYIDEERQRQRQLDSQRQR